MPKVTKAPAKKKSTAKVGGGGVGTRVSKLNLKIVIPIVVLVAALGGFYIFKKSSAATWVTHSTRSFSTPLVISASGSGGIHVFFDGSTVIGEPLSGPYSYRYCAWVRAPKGRVKVEYWGAIAKSSFDLPQSTSFTKKCGGAVQVGKNDRPHSPYMQISNRNSDAATVEVQRATIERM